MAGIRHQELELKEDIEDLERRMATLEANDQTLLFLKQAVTRIRDRLSDFDFHRKRLALEALAIRVTFVNKGLLEVSGLIPLEQVAMENQEGEIWRPVPVTS